MSKSAEKPPKFEDAIAQLETIIDQIESGQIGLEESITQYERGMKLVTRCQSILDDARRRIAELTTAPGSGAGGKLEIKDQGGADDSADEEAEALSDDDDE